MPKLKTKKAAAKRYRLTADKTVIKTIKKKLIPYA